MEDETRKQISDLIPCIDSYCDKNGTTVDGNLDDGPEPAQCQYCYEVRFPMIDKLQALLDSHIVAVLDKLEDKLLDNSIALKSEETAVKWDEVVVVLDSLRQQYKTGSKI